MQQLELTEKHKEQLLEMCNKLFNDKSIYNFRILTLQFTTITVVCPQYYSNVGNPHGWFEFCLLHIAPAIYKKLPKIQQADLNFMGNGYTTIVANLMYCFKNNKIHPVDYLYQQFKLLKLK